MNDRLYSFTMRLSIIDPIFYLCRNFFFHATTAPSGIGPPSFRGFTITLRHTTLGWTPLYEWSARRRDLYPTTHTTSTRETMPTANFEPPFPASEPQQNHALDSGRWDRRRNNASSGFFPLAKTSMFCYVTGLIFLMIWETWNPPAQYSDNTLRCCKYKLQVKKVKGKICPRTGYEDPEGDPRKDQLPIKYGSGLTPGPVWTGAENTPTPPRNSILGPSSP